ncbi:MAG: PH domain-containing protein [Rhodospirillaceae bacterium]|nr:PH domain-containing protein [Rhodospirillales bacterium]
MPTLEQIQQQIKQASGLDSSLWKREVKELPSILTETEAVEAILQGVYGNNLGVFVATMSRILFVDKGMFGGLKVEEFHYEKISSVQFETGLIQGKLKIFTSGNTAEITNCDKRLVRLFAEYVQGRLSAPKVSPDSGGDVLEKLERLAKLKEQGILSDEEFQQQKAKILA